MEGGEGGGRGARDHVCPCALRCGQVEVQDKKHIIDSLKRALHESQDPLTVSFLSRNRFADMLGNIWEREEREKEKVQATVRDLGCPPRLSWFRYHSSARCEAQRSE